jgi:PAS domain S-box-containing protein
MTKERNRAGGKLRDSDEGFRLLVDCLTTYAIFMLDPQGTVVSWNPGAERITGYRAKEIMGQNFSRFYTEEDIEVGKPTEQLRAAAEEGPLEDEALRVRKDGSQFWASVVIAALRDETGELRGFANVTRDISRRKRAEEATERVRRRTETLVETSPVGVVVVDARGRLVLVNREAERLSDYSYKRGDPLETLHEGAIRRRPDGTDYALEELPLSRALSHGETVRAEEMRFHFADGRTTPALVNAAPICRADGEITGAVAIIQDITPLEELEKLRSEFLGIVSHELKTPLMAIKGSAALALGGRDPMNALEARELFAIIDEQVDRLTDLVNNLLDMTRIEAGTLTVNPEPTDLRTLLEELREASTRRHSPHEIRIQLPDELPAVNADPWRIGQVLSNLVSNAAKFSREGEPIEITVERGPSQVTVHVRDRGRGIPADKLPHLFKKFSRVHEGHGPGLPGSGLGLAICKGIVEAHGGRIWVESGGEGRGSTFSFTLPVVAAEPAAPAAETARRAEHIGRVTRPGERTRILAVDDDPQILRFLQRALQEAGYQPVVTADATEAPGLVELEEPDLVLLDLFLPGTSGFDLLKQIREFSGVPVIFLTASDKEEDAVHALQAGADDYITKPFSISELVARIAAALRRRVMPDVTEVRPPFVLDDLTIDFIGRGVTVAGRPVSLSATEYKLLYELVTHAGQVLTHDQILQRVWGPHYSGETKLIRSFIRNLRRKLGDDARRPRYIFTEPHVGYRVPRSEPQGSSS